MVITGDGNRAAVSLTPSPPATFDSNAADASESDGQVGYALSMVVKLIAPAKLTLSLHITGVRNDGYHLIEAEMVTVDLVDSLRIEEGDSLTVLGGGPDVVADESNLVNQALKLVNRKAAVTLNKQIPSKAGLGGGSADAGAILRWAGHTDAEQAATLGADVPFCVAGGRAKVSGIGERVEPSAFKEMTLTLFTPPVDCPTAEIFAAWDNLKNPESSGSNDLEEAACVARPELQKWRSVLAEETGKTPHLAGSGSTWFVFGSYPSKGRRVVRTLNAEK